MATYAPPPGVVGPTWTTEQIKAIISTIAAQLGLPTDIALAAAQTESGFDPYRVGDKGTSYGLFQLHAGGELEQIPGPRATQVAGAFDPTTNARVALRQIAAVYQQDPGADPGVIVANAQRPADKPAYAKVIDAILGRNADAAAGGGSGGPTVQPVGDNGPFGGGNGTTTYGLGFGPHITIWSWDRIGFAVLGGLLLLLGIYLTFKGGDTIALPGSGGPEPAPAGNSRGAENAGDDETEGAPERPAPPRRRKKPAAAKVEKVAKVAAAAGA